MNPSKKTLDEKLSELETISNVAEHEIEKQISSLRNDENDEEPCSEWQYEFLAFSFIENYPEKSGGWGTYFGPKVIWENDEGNMVEFPSIQAITEATLSYWETRAYKTTNSILQARYSGLVWEFSKSITNKNPHHSFAEIYCKSLLETANSDNHKYKGNVVKKLERALFIAISLNNPALISEAKISILKYEKKISIDTKPGLWGFSFDLLVGNKKVNLTPEEEGEIITELETKLGRLYEVDSWSCEKAAERLAKYYTNNNKPNESIRVIKILGKSFETSIHGKDPMIASSMLEHIYNIYIQFNLLSDADRVSKVIRDLGPKIVQDMKEFSVEIEIPREEIDSYIDKIVKGDLDQVLKNIALQHIPQVDAIENQLQDLAKRAPLTFLLKKQITAHDGRTVAVVGPLEEDLSGNVVSQMSQNMYLQQPLLSSVFDRTQNQFDLNANILVNYLLNCPVIRESQKAFLSEGLKAFFSGNFLVSIHLLIPQIESIARNLLELTGGAVLKPRHGGGYHYITLGEILRSDHVKKSIGEDISFYLRVVLTDQRGWNIRNDVCHGISRSEELHKGIAERLIQILLLFAQLRESET